MKKNAKEKSKSVPASSILNQLKDYEIPISDRYKLDSRKKLGSGSFGEIYLGKSLRSNEDVAIKLEPVTNQHPQLFHENKVYSAFQGGPGIPKIYWYGKQGNYNILVMETLGPSLEDIFNEYGCKFSLQTSLMSMDQMITRIEYIHSKGFIHRDVKPDNFLIGKLSKKELIYIIDFGLAKRYKDPKTGAHIPYDEGKSLIGTARYASINTHLGVDQSRRDDIEALGYILVYFLKGSLPWQGLKAKNMKEKYDKIKEKKISTSINELCEGLSREVVKFMTYARELKFDVKPDYIFLKNILRQIMKDNKLAFSTYKFDWLTKNGEK